jgi:hypothetical protein
LAATIVALYAKLPIRVAPMPPFATSIVIAAPVATIWAILTDAPAFPAWNSTVEAIDGRIAPNEKVTVRTKASPGRAFPVRVTRFDAPREMVWTGGMPLGLFTGTRVFSLAPGPDGRVTFSMREDYRGLMAPLIVRSIPDLQPAFDIFAADLKRRAEAAG